MMNFTNRTRLILAVTMLWCAAARGYFLDDIGITAMRAATNLDGSGIRVAQPEASLTLDNLTWEVNPATVGLPAAKFTYTSTLGTATNFPNAIGADSSHATSAVGTYFYGLSYGSATNVARVDNYEANYFINNIVSTLTPIAASIVNQSFVDTDTNFQTAYDTAYDNYAAQFHTLFVSGAGNGSAVFPPSTCYNGISVGAYYDYANQGSIGPTPFGGRCKPDITAPSVYTSTTTPLVAGAAAMLEQAALRGDGGGNTNLAFDLRTIKALLLNGAVKSANWTNANSAPLDARYGAGVLNIFNSWKQLTGGKRGYIVSNSVLLHQPHPPTGSTGTVSALFGWDFTTNTSTSLSPKSDGINHYFFNVSNSLAAVKFSATATLVWHRHSGQTYINNLNLYLYNCANSNLVLCSTSAVDNVEHLWTNSLAQGRYDLQVWKAGGTGLPGDTNFVSGDEPYALAWEFVPPPALAISGGPNAVLTWPSYPAGFLVEARTNLLSGAWSTNGFGVPLVTNTVNGQPLNATNATQFFRLRKPNL